jgi:hypothetical protein
LGRPERSTTLLRNWRLRPLAAAIVAAGAFGSGDDQAASLVVGTLAEQSASACTLRDALDAVNFQSDLGQCVASGAYGSDDSVAFAPGLTGTLTFFNRDPLSNPGDPSALVVQRSVVVQGPGSTQLSLACGNVFYRLLEIDASALAVSISGVTLSDCTSRGAGGGVRVMNNVAQSVQFTDVTLTNDTAKQGGGLAVLGGFDGATVTLTACNVLTNHATGAGGGVALSSNGAVAAAELSIADSVLTQNTAPLGAGAYAFGTTADIAFTRSTLAGNLASSGGGIEVETGASASILDSTLSGNQAGISGGGVRVLNGASFAATNSTLSGNLAGLFGGGVYALGLGNGAIFLANTTIANNQAQGGGGVAIENTFPIGQMTPTNAISIVDTIVAGNPATSDTLSTELPGNVLPWNVAHSVIEVPGNVDLVGTGNITGAAVPPPFGASGWLGALQNNGGPTLTHALLVGVPDPAVNAGDPTFSGLAFDQRGPPFLRVQNHRVDIGAYEVQSTGPVGAVPVPGPGRIALLLLAGLLGLLGWRRRG